MRGAIAGFVWLAIWPSAMAQTPQTVAPAPTAPKVIAPVAPVQRPERESLPAARRIVVALLPTGDAMPAAVRAVSTDLPRQIESSLRGQGAKRQLSSDETVKLDAYILALPHVIDDVIVSVLPAMRESMARKFSAAYSREEAEGIAAFFESPPGLAFVAMVNATRADAAAQGIEGDPEAEAAAVLDGMTGMSAEHLQAFVAFTRTPSGKAYKREGHTFDGIVAQELTVFIQTPLMNRILKDLCQQIPAKFCA